MKKVLVSIFVLSVLWWVTIFFRGIRDVTEAYMFNLPMALIPILAGCYIMYLLFNTKAQEGAHFLRKALYFSSAGIISWGFWNIVYLYYNLILKKAVVYPGVPDLCYFFASGLWIIGLLYTISFLGKRRLFLVSFWKVCVLIFVFFISSCCLYLFVANDFHVLFSIQRLIASLLTTIPDFILFFEICFLLYIIISSKNFKFLLPSMCIAIGFGFAYCAGIFYLKFNNTFFVGSWIDLLFFSGVFFQSMGLIYLFDKVLLNFKNTQA